jgi:hypothetical protein
LRIDLYEWEYLKFGDQKGLRTKPISLTPLTGKAQERKSWKEQPAEKPTSTAPATEEAAEKREDKEQTKKKSLFRL